MSRGYQSLIERIRGEITDLEQVIDRAEQAWSLIQRASPTEQPLYVDSVALNLHGFYSGVEHLFELIARHVDGNLPDSGNWHRDLLQQMAQDLPMERPQCRQFRPREKRLIVFWPVWVIMEKITGGK